MNLPNFMKLFVMSLLKSQWILYSCVFNSCFSANILITENFPSPSHQIWNYAIAEGLLGRGHNVTLIGPLTINPLKHENYTHIVIEEVPKVIKELDLVKMKFATPYERMMILYNLLKSCCQITYRSNGFRTLLNYSGSVKYDLIVIAMSSDGCFLPLIAKFGYPPTVGIDILTFSSSISTQFGNELYPSYVPHYNTYYNENMDFFQRIWNYFYSYYDLYYRTYSSESEYEKLSKQTFGSQMASVSDLKKHISLCLVNWSPILHYPQPMIPSIIPIAGSHIKLKSLDENINKILDESTNGVILFSLGTNLKSNQLSLEKRSAILKAFSQLPQTVLWKFESNIEHLPHNVIVSKWMPQNEILSHPNTKLFISHAGGLSTVETTYFGVPMLGIPFFADQHHNIEMLISKGIATKFNFDTLNWQNFLSAINEILNNRQYMMKAKQLSGLMRDQPETPMERALFWLEYAIRNNGTELDPKSRHLPLFVSSCMDIKLSFIFILMVLLILFLRR